MQRPTHYNSQIAKWLALCAAVCMLFACERGNTIMTNSKLVDTSRYFTDPKVAAFVDSVQRGEVAKVQQGLIAGIPANAIGTDGFRPIHFAFAPASPEVLKLLLRAGADPTAPLGNKNSPLHFAVRQPDPEFTAVLLAAKADPNAAGDSKEPVLFTALAYKNPTVVEYLVKAGANVNVEWGNMSPFFSAVSTFNWSIAGSLLKLGADPNFKDKKGWSALDELCQSLARAPVEYKDNKDQVGALLAILTRRGVNLPCSPAVLRWQ